MDKNTRKVVGIGLFTAIVVVLQLLGSFIRFGTFSISLVLIPIVVGAALYGKAAGAWLGTAFGIAVFISGDANAFLAINPAGTIITVLLKGLLAGLVTALIYGLIEKKNQIVATIAAAVVCPLVNTGIFLIGCSVFFMDTIKQWADGAGFGSNVGTYMIVGLVGLNFVFEFLVNLVLSPVIIQLVKIGKKEAK